MSGDGSAANGRTSLSAKWLARFPHLAGDLRGGFASAVIGLPYAVTSAMIAFAPLGPGYIGHGMLAGVLTALVAGLVTAVVGGTPCQINGPRASVAVLMASIIAAALAHPALQGMSGAEAPRALGVAMLCLMWAGALQVAFGVLRMGSFLRFLPYPVISGFMVGLGILVALPQIPALFGIVGNAGWAQLLREPGLNIGSLLVGAITIAVFLWVRKSRPKLPAPVLAMLAGTLLHYLLAATPLGAGPTAWDTIANRAFPPMPWRVPEFVFDSATFSAIIDLLPAVATLAFVASLESLLSSSVLGIASNMRYSSRLELIGQGLSNIAIGVVGGVASCGAPFRGVTNFAAGGRTRFSSVVNALLIGTVGLAGASLLFGMPLAAWAAVLAVIGWDVASTWARRLAGSPRTEIAVGFLVMFVTLALGTVPAILVGIAGSMFLYIHSTSRAPIRGHFDGTARSSLRVRPDAQLAFLREQGAAIRVIELQGSLFFGTAHRCGREMERIAGDCAHVIVDLARVSEIDATGALVLMQTARRISENGSRIALASVMPGGRRGQVLVLAGMARTVPETAWFRDVDSALEHIENELLARRWPGHLDARELGVAQMDLCAGMEADEIAALQTYLRRETYADGSVLFAEGEPGDRMFLIAKGAVTVRIDLLRKKDRARRLRTYGPGVIIGDMAVLENKARSADAVCEGETVLHVLEQDALVRMAREQPALYGRFLFNLSREMASRLRALTRELRAALD